MPETYCTYTVGGWLLASDFAFATPLTPAAGAPQLTFTCVSDAPCEVDWRGLTPVHRNPLYVPQGVDELTIYRLDTMDLLRFGEVADFYLAPERIICHARQTAWEYIESQFLTTVLAYWQEQRGVVVLHAAAVAMGTQAIALAAFSGGGKSSLTTALLQAGHALLADDNLTLRWANGRVMAAPAYPQVRLWAAQAGVLLGRAASPANGKTGFPLDGLGRFCTQAKSLTTLYLLERAGAPPKLVEIISLSPAAAVFALARHSYVANQLNLAGRPEQRLDFFARLVSQVAVRRLVYASGVEHLPAVCRALAQDCNRH